MSHVYVAASKSLQIWGAEVGLGRHLYAIGVCAEGTPDGDALSLGGRDDWTIIKSQRVERDPDLTSLTTRLSVREKRVDPAYYPALRGLDTVFKIDPVHVENALLLEAAMADGPLPQTGTKAGKLKPATIAAYMLKLALGAQE